jgi:uncharacterized membrane-anchored protein YhcB (DUF1043 family)
MRKIIIIISLIIGILTPSMLIAVERAPRISDREIVERLTKLEEGQRSLERRLDDLRSEMNSRFDTMQWMFGLFITIALVTLGFVLRMQWQMHKRQTRMETILDTHKDDLAFLKGLIEKLLPPKGVL